MSNPKTQSSSHPKPETDRGWVRKCHLDDYLDRHLPIPTQVVSNEEFAPLPQTPQQQAVEHRLLEIASRSATRLGMDRRQFLRTSCGMAAAFAAMNSVFGRFFTVDAAELLEPAAVVEKSVKYFIFDAQTHHVEAIPSISPNDRAVHEYLLGLRRFGGRFNPALKGGGAAMEEIYRQNYIKEIFLDSETDMAVLSGLPQVTPETYILAPDEIARTRSWVNELTGSRRVVTHGVMSPELGARNLEAMRAQAEKLKLEAWKGYPGQPLGPNGEGWWLDDEKIAYPALELSRKLRIKNICLHKGLPLPNFSEEHCHPKDIFRAAESFPELNFLVYHSGFKGIADALPAAQSEFQTSSYIPWVSDLCEWKKKNPQIRNVYMELGTTFGMMVISFPLLCGHVLGMILEAFGDDHVLWGTDSIWWGSPQWQIEALKRFEMPEQLQKRFGYKPLTPEVKSRIFGLNAARVYGVDPKARRNPVPGDYIDRLKKKHQEAKLSLPSNTQYGWVQA